MEVMLMIARWVEDKVYDRGVSDRLGVLPWRSC